MKLYLAILLLLSLALGAGAQTKDYGFCIGASNFLGDLGGGKGIGSMGPKDVDVEATRPAFGIFYRFNHTPRSGIRFSFHYAQLSGSDLWVRHRGVYTDEWFRYIRGLNFKTNIAEASIQYEYNLLSFQPGTRRFRFTPYVLGGGGIFHFNPKGSYQSEDSPDDPRNGEWVELQPLGTEGQGLPQYPERKPYRLTQPCLIFGAGIKYNLNRNWSIGFESAYRITFTDYLDDVSTTYVPAPYFADAYTFRDPKRLADLEGLHNKSFLADPEGEYYFVTDPEEEAQRGDPSNKDHYFFAGMLCITYTLHRGFLASPKF